MNYSSTCLKGLRNLSIMNPLFFRKASKLIFMHCPTEEDRILAPRRRSAVGYILSQSCLCIPLIVSITVFWFTLVSPSFASMKEKIGYKSHYLSPALCSFLSMFLNHFLPKHTEKFYKTAQKPEKLFAFSIHTHRELRWVICVSLVSLTFCFIYLLTVYLTTLSSDQIA